MPASDLSKIITAIELLLPRVGMYPLFLQVLSGYRPPKMSWILDHPHESEVSFSWPISTFSVSARDASATGSYFPLVSASPILLTVKPGGLANRVTFRDNQQDAASGQFSTAAQWYLESALLSLINYTNGIFLGDKDGADANIPCFIPGYDTSIIEARAFGAQTSTTYSQSRANPDYLDTANHAGHNNSYKQIVGTAITDLTYKEADDYFAIAIAGASRVRMSSGNGPAQRSCFYVGKTAFSQLCDLAHAIHSICFNANGQLEFKWPNKDVYIVEEPRLEGKLTGTNTNTVVTGISDNKPVIGIFVGGGSMFLWGEKIWQKYLKQVPAFQGAENQMALLKEALSSYNPHTGALPPAAVIARTFSFGPVTDSNGEINPKTMNVNFDFTVACAELSALGCMICS